MRGRRIKWFAQMAGENGNREIRKIRKKIPERGLQPASMSMAEQ
jgi:hypothetical protein